MSLLFKLPPLPWPLRPLWVCFCQFSYNYIYIYNYFINFEYRKLQNFSKWEIDIFKAFDRIYRIGKETSWIHSFVQHYTDIWTKLTDGYLVNYGAKYNHRLSGPVRYPALTLIITGKIQHYYTGGVGHLTSLFPANLSYLYEKSF